MYIELKYLFKKARITESEIQIGKLNIDIENITEIKFQMATTLRQGFITFCTLNGGQEVSDLNTSTLDKNSIMFYKKDNVKVSTMLEYFFNIVQISEASELKERYESEKLKAKVRVEELKEESMNRAKKLKEENERMSKMLNQNSKPIPKVSYIPSKVSKPIEHGVIHCPKCGGTQLTTQKKGFGLAKGVAGVLTFGAYGLLTAGIGKNKIIITCLKCGKQFKPGKGK
ncbi:MAG: hypothetical protein RR851_14635 [Clostridium sp.]